MGIRTIIFRGKRKDNGEWIEGYYASQSNHACLANELKHQHFIFKDVCLDFNLGGLQEFKVIPETVGQYTGLTDKNGKKIFEGDIIRYADLYDYNCYLESIDNPEVYDNIDLGNIWTIDEVVYGIKYGYPAFDLNKHDFETNGLSELSESGQYFYEVIGNIHDNPELLKGGEK